MRFMPFSADRRRFKAFDTMITAAAEAYANPEIAAKLGVLGVDLAAINQAAFLPTPACFISGGR